jgi:LacI family transcriptional regulator
VTTLRDISRHLGLSVTQVSRALNGHGDVAEDTRARVRAAARRLNYQPNLSARRLATGRSGVLGLVLPDVPREGEEGEFVQIVGGLSRHLSRLGRSFVLHMADPAEDIAAVHRRLSSSGAIEGFVLLEPRVRDSRVAWLRRAGVPFVIHGRVEEPEDYAFYDIDNRAVGETLTRLLLAAGHRRLAFLNGQRDRTYALSRRTGWRAALAAAGVAEAEAQHRWGPMTEGEGLLAGADLWREGGLRPTGVICGNARLARGLMLALGALGLRVPQDVSVVVHDDDLPGLRPAAFDPPLTVTRSPLSEAWEPLARFLAAMADGAPAAACQAVGRVELIERGSVCPPRAAS